MALVGEASTANDDRADDIVAAPIGRLATIEEDEARMHLLVGDQGGGLSRQE